ncbi:MAG: cobalamin-dependent protein [Deltaproteobacteria bacterium]|nr:cobalamin-dependent protein [Deltaproteobacteria bacterium]
MKTHYYSSILLVHPLGYNKEAAGKDVSRMTNIMPPLGLAGIAAYLEREGIESAVVDSYAYPESDRAIRKYIFERRPAFIGFSCTTSSFLDGIRIAGMAKAIYPDIRVVFGGPHVSALRKRILEDFPVVDYCVTGEGEVTLTELIKSAGEDPASIQGLVYRDRSNGVCITETRANIAELDTLPFPAYEKLKNYPAAYRLPIFNYPRTPNASFISSRGCPYACAYCDRSVFGRSFRYNSAEYIYEHLVYLKRRFGVRHINFYDDQFTFNRDRIVTLTEMMMERSLEITFNCVIRAEHVDLDLIRRMKRAGCWMISLGIETGDKSLLAQHRRNVDLDMLKEKVHMISRERIRVKGLFMLGLPGETEETMNRSIRYFLSLPIDELNVAKFTPFPGSPLYQNIHDLGEFEEDWEKMDCMNFLFVPKGMTRDVLEDYFIRFYKAHFTRLRTLWNYFTMLWRSPDSWRRFLGNLGGFIRFAKSDKRLGEG